MNHEILMVGYFQLENLMINQVHFFFVDIRAEVKPVTDEPIKTYVARATRLSSEDVSGWLKEKAPDMQVPVVLLCEDGKNSTSLAHELSAEGYVNIYVIDGGLKGLLDEGQSLTHS